MSGFYDGAKRAFLKGQIDVENDTLKVCLVDLDDEALAVTAATNASPIALTTATHGLTTGDYVTVSGVLGNTAANGYWAVTVTGPTTFTLVGSVGNGAWTSGGRVADLSNKEYLDDLGAGAVVATTTLNSVVVLAHGTVDAANATFSTVSGDTSEALVVYKDTGSAATSPLICMLDANTTPGLPVTPLEADVGIVWSSSGLFGMA